MKEQDKIKRCAFCSKACDTERVNEEPAVWGVLCDKCNCGFFADTQEEAINKWKTNI